MEQFRQLGEVLGSIKSLMVFKDDIQINQRQCFLLMDMLSLAYDSVAEEIRQNLRFEEKNTKWKIVEQPLKELHRIFKEGEGYIRQCLETKDWWAKAITLYHNTDCIDLHIHNLLSCIFIVIESIETAGEMSGWDLDETQKKKLVYSNKYRKELKDFKVFQWKYGKEYLISQDICNRFDAVWKEDRWILLNRVQEKRNSVSSKFELRLTDLLLKNLDGSGPLNGKLLPSSFLVGSKDYQVRRRLGCGSQYKEILWLGESFALRHFFGDIESLMHEISSLLSLSHPNIMQYLCAFTDNEKKECFLIMELMSRDLFSYIKEICGPRKRIPFSLPVAVDMMLQIARGMEYLHSKRIYHGELNPCNILVKGRGSSTEAYLHVKISGFGLSSVMNFTQKNSSNQSGILPFIWYAPEVLEEQEQTGSGENFKYKEKSDVYSFGMLCFELVTGKVPFEDSHLQGDKMSRNIRAGERPLFPFNSPKYVTNLTKKCWHPDPNQRPSFSSICRNLRYIKRFLAMNPDYNSQSDPLMPVVDYWDIETAVLREFPLWGSSGQSPISEVPFQMFVYRVAEREKVGVSSKDNSESGSDGASACGDEIVSSIDDPFLSVTERKSVTSPDSTTNKKLASSKTSAGTPKGRSVRPPQLAPCGRSMRTNSESQLLVSPSSMRMNSESQLMVSPRIRRTSSGHVSDSELP